MFHNLKSNAKKRGKFFALSYQDFIKVITAYGKPVLTDRGRKSKSISFDRIDPERGYEPGNVQIISLGENVRRSNEIRNELPDPF